jgi:xylulokinase
MARAFVEGVLCGLADGLDALVGVGVSPTRVLMVGGAATSEAVRQVAPTVLGLPVDVPEPGEYVADGACRQAAWVLSGAEEPPAWQLGATRRYAADPHPATRARYAEAREHHLDALRIP